MNVFLVFTDGIALLYLIFQALHFLFLSSLFFPSSSLSEVSISAKEALFCASDVFSLLKMI